MKPDLKREAMSGRVELVGDRLSYTGVNGTAWSIKLAEVRLIAEETIEALGDDWLIHIALQSEWVRFPFYAAGFRDVWDRLGERFPGMELGLADSTSFKSRVLWPADLRGQPLFEYQLERNPSWWRRLTGSRRIESTLTPMVSNFLAGA
ncbi:MAG: hypothetical protein LAT64_00675 [Phycisphaerales bacterium]|nr:hypothetical protein [Planctomycetota bacterium]MCH8507276.1 hypothetical protein [Phycisphaerales bacterium]